MSAPPIDPKYAAQERMWRAESALSTIAAAEKHKQDAGLMRDVKRLAAQQIKSLSRVARTPSRKK